MKLEINKWLIVAVLVGVVVLIISLAKGCNNQKRLSKINIDLDGRVKYLTAKSAEDDRQLAAYRDSMQFLDGQLSLSDNKLLFLNEDLGRANDRIGTLLKKHVPILPSLDTNVTTVGNEFIDECADCFKELSNGQQLVVKYKAEKDNQEQLYKGKLGVKDNRIKYLEMSNTSLSSKYSSLIDSASKVERKRMLYFSYGVLWSAYVPKSVGAGLMYQDKRLRQFGVKGYFGAHKPMIETQVNMPLSLRRKK